MLLSMSCCSSKRFDPDATGRYGLGFSSVYHWTSRPSFWFGSTAVFLDPSGNLPSGGNVLCIDTTNKHQLEEFAEFEPWKVLRSSACTFFQNPNLKTVDGTFFCF